MSQDRWILPEGIEEILPPQARKLEDLRRLILDRFFLWGYELVMPPLIEYLESLLTGTGRDLDLQTFKLIDQLNGRMMGVRADITPQVARIDAHRLRREVPTRLCYMGAVLHTRSDSFAGSRSPLQLGAELYGHRGVASDIEIISLMLEVLALAGVGDLYLDLGHVDIYRGLARQAALNADQEAELFEMLQRKSAPEIEAFVGALQVDAKLREAFLQLIALNGDESVLRIAREILAPAGQAVLLALDYLESVAEAVKAWRPNLTLHFDLAEFRGYHYETGIVFTAYQLGYGQEIARGGRYDHIGQVFGRARPATGFSTDLHRLAALGSHRVSSTDAIFAPPDKDPALWNRIEELRNGGQTVICGLPGQSGGVADLGCSRRLAKTDAGWTLVDE
jgi:ATP phosphoribosyltransferase regulatory subunit